MTTQISLKEFLNVLEKPVIVDDRTSKPVRQLGLIIYSKESESALKQLQTSFGKEKIAVVSIQNANDAILFQSHLQSALDSGDVVLIDIKSDLHPTVIEMFKSFGEKNSYKDLDTSIDMSRPIICTASKEIVEATISYPYFYNLFGPVYHLD